MKCIFFGTPAFAARTLEFMLDAGVDVVAVVSKPDRPKGRSGKPVPTPVKQVALEHGLPLFQPEKASTSEFVDEMTGFAADLFVVVAYGEIINQALLDVPKLACVNVHASLLPKYRGAAPIQRAIMNGEVESGVTIMHMVKRMDAGDIIKQVKTPIEEQMTAGELEGALCELGCTAIVETIEDFSKGRASRTPQDPALVTFANKIELEDTEVLWAEPALTLHNLIRGTQPRPGAWCWVEHKGQKKRLKLQSTRVDRESQGQPGEILAFGKQELKIACGDGALLLEELQLEGKRRMRASEFVSGVQEQELRFSWQDSSNN